MGLMKNRCLLYPFIHISELKLHWEITNWIFFCCCLQGKLTAIKSHWLCLHIREYWYIHPLINYPINLKAIHSYLLCFPVTSLPYYFFSKRTFANICKKKKRVEGIKKQLAMHMSWKIGKMLKNSKKNRIEKSV